MRSTREAPRDHESGAAHYKLGSIRFTKFINSDKTNNSMLQYRNGLARNKAS